MKKNIAMDQLTKGQEDLLEKFQAFLDGPEKFFLLTGKPGVGKTYMTKKILSDYIEADKKNEDSFDKNINVAGICLAHQAKNVLGEHIPNVFTFAKAYGLKENHDDLTGKRTFIYDPHHHGTIIGEQTIPVFIHDEVSQYTEEMLKIVFEKTSMYSKIIFIGDRAQLPPIDPQNKMGADADSPIFRYDVLDDCKHELTERVRQASNNPILDLSDIIREEIFGLQRVNRVLQAMNDPCMIDSIGHNVVRYSAFLDHISKKEIEKTRVIAFTNKAINKLNPLIRNHLMNNPEEILVPNDLVAMKDSFYSFDEFGYVNYILFNSEILKIKKLFSKVFRYKAFGKNYRIDTYVADIVGREGRFIIPTESGQIILDEALDEIAKKCRQNRNWKVFWDLRKSFCNWAYGYATTAYKSQGSTYNTIYLNVDDVISCRALSRKRQLQTIYTAITRAKEDVYFLKQ